MTKTLKHIIHSIFRKRFERVNSQNIIEPYFERFIGVENIEEYNDILKTLKEKCDENKNECLIFDNSIEMIAELELLQYIFVELNNMDITRMVNQEIAIFDNYEVNYRFLQALDYVIPLAIRKENFFNENVRNNFIAKLIVWAFSYVKNINYTGDINPKCVYYGTIGRHEIYFLIILHLLSFDVIYINPLKEEYFDEIDEDNISSCNKFMSILQIESLNERCSKGKVIENVETITMQIQRDVQEQLFSNTGVFVPWQFRKGYTKSLQLETIVEDIYIYWTEPAKLRDGFKVEGTTVSVPCFFKKIDGIYRDKFEYQRLVKHCIESPNTLFFNSGKISADAAIKDELYSAMFCQLSDGTFDIEEIKKLPIFNFKKYSEEIQNLLLNKFNETIKDKDLFTKPLDRELALKFLGIVLVINPQIIKLIDNFDFTANIPKIVIYLDGEDGITDTMQMLLGYLHTIGLDIVIFNPSGLLNLNNVLKESAVSSTRLEEISYTSKYKDIFALKQGVLSRILKK